MTAEVTIEHKYVFLVLSLDQPRHPILKGIRKDMPNASIEEYSQEDFISGRVRVIEGEPTPAFIYFTDCYLAILTNLEILMDQTVNGQANLEYESQKWIGFLLIMLSTMKTTLEVSVRL